MSVQLSGVACERPDSLVPGMRGAKHVRDHRGEHRHLLLHEGEALCEESHRCAPPSLRPEIENQLDAPTVRFSQR